MKKIIIIFIIIVALGLVYLLFNKYMPPYTPTKTVKLMSGLKIPNNVVFEKDTSFYSFTGEGYAEIVLKLNNEQYEELLKKNDLSKFTELPIREKLPEALPEGYFKYMQIDTLNKYYYSQEDTLNYEASGYYKFKEYEKNESFKITVIDKIKQKVLIYSFND